MNRAYLILVAVLILATLTVGGFAIYRTVRGGQNGGDYRFLTQPPLTSPKTVKTEPKKTATPAAVSEEPISNNLPLTITSPQLGQQITSPKVVVSGETTAGADVTVNNLEVKANSSGKFQATLLLEDGENPIYVFASDSEGNFAEWQGAVTYTPAE